MRRTTFSSLFNKVLTAIVIVALGLMALPAMSVSAATVTVTTTVDENINNADCSLREAIIAANNNASHNGCIYTGSGPDDVITLTSGATYTLSITGNNEDQGDLDIGNAAGTSGDLTIQASGTTNAIIDANEINRVIEVDAPGNIDLTLIHITITNGLSTTGAGIDFEGAGTLTLTNSVLVGNVATGPSNCGAGIYNGSAATINIVNSTFESNRCTGTGADGGGIYKNAGGTLTIANSTFHDNSVTDNGAGVLIDILGGTATITNSTFANNVAGGRGGGVQVASGTVTIQFSTFSGNSANMNSASTGGSVQATGGSVSVIRSILANSTGFSGVTKDCDQLSPGTVALTNTLVENNSDCTGSISSTADPELSVLQDSGGPTLTMAITSSSPAFNAASTCGSITADQRGVSRPQGAACDLGAYEFETAPVAPGKASLVSPSGSGSDNTPTYTWNQVSGSTWYYLWVNGPSGNIIQQWYTSAQANCNGSTCSVTPATTLGNGAHTWWIQTYGAGGDGPWSDPMSFTVTPPAPPALPGKATLVSPNGSTSDTTPTYSWNEVSGATWYYLWVNGPSGTVIQRWYAAAEANCGGGTCSVTPSQVLSAGTHTWWIQTYNAAGDGPWSDAMNFTVTPPAPPALPGKATLVSPSGSTADTTPTYTWNEVSGSTWYYLWVNGPSGVVLQQWYTAAQANCNGSTCSVTPSQVLSAGSHTWWIQTYNAAGDGPWSDAMSFTIP